jgi:hypothetical protein
MKRSEVEFKCHVGEHEVTGIVVNPGGWFGKVWLIQIAISNALNPFYAVEADHEASALDIFADSRFSHLIDVEGPVTDDEEECYQRCGNDGHLVDLSNTWINKAPENLEYTMKWHPEKDQDLSNDVDSLLEEVRKEIEEEKEAEKLRKQ